MNDAGSGGGGDHRRYESGGGTNGSTAGLTLGGILSINETAPYRIHNRTLLDLIRDDQISVTESKKTWKMFRDKLRLKLAGSVCTTTVTTVASHVHITTGGNRTTPRTDTNRSNSHSPLVVAPVTDTQTSPVPEIEQTLPEENRTDGGDGVEPPTVKMSLKALLEVDGSACFEDDDEGTAEEVVEDGGGGGGGGGYKYNNCCVCMVRHKGAAFIPCGHTFCRLCSRELFVKRANCPLCNNFILEILDIF